MQSLNNGTVTEFLNTPLLAVQRTFYVLFHNRRKKNGLAVAEVGDHLATTDRKYER